VWSLGVIFYQMLYGKRPFGEGKSQERVLSEGIMLNATQVEFPQEVKPLPSSQSPAASASSSSSSLIQVPKVTEEAKDFIRTCLTWDQKLRCLPPLFLSHHRLPPPSAIDPMSSLYANILTFEESPRRPKPAWPLRQLLLLLTYRLLTLSIPSSTPLLLSPIPYPLSHLQCVVDR
jgi:serine/threonine protein kinase